MNITRANAVTRGTAAEGEIVAKLDFDPKVNGYSFENYVNDPPRHWQTDLGADDLIRMFGPAAVCKSGTTARDCVMKASARQWMEQELRGMGGGHCEGLAVTCLRMEQGLPFKSFVGPSTFQAGAKSTFGLKPEKAIENYIAYYFVTQSFREVAAPTKETGKQGPVAVVKMLIDAMNSGDDTYTLGIYKCEDCDKPDGHAITPFAVEDDGGSYKIHVYDNNFPGETRYVTVDKGGKQTWKYTTATNPNEPADVYTGNFDTKTLELTGTSLRDGKCFEAPFARNDPKATGCSIDSAKPVKPEHPAGPEKPAAPAGPAPVAAPTMESEGEDADFFLTGPGDMLVLDGNDKKVGFDPKSGKFFDEIEDAEVDFVSGGRGQDMPHYILPFDANAKPYVVVFSGRNLKKKNVMDFVYSGPGFTVGFDGIKLDPGEVLVAEISPDGEHISMAHSNDGEMPEVFYSMDTPGKSFSAVIKGQTHARGPGPAEPESEEDYAKDVTADLERELHAAGGSPKDKVNGVMTIDFDDETGKLQVADTGSGDESFDVDLEQFDARGKTSKIQLNDLGKDNKGADRYEIEVGKWDGGGKIAVKHDDEGNGFDDDEEMLDENEPNDINDDPDKDGGGGALMAYLYSSIGW